MKFIQDIFELDVVTVTGDINLKLTEEALQIKDGTRQVITFDSIFKAVGKDLKSVADIRVIAASQIKIDKDTYTFIAEPKSDRDLDLMKLHFETVATALEGRSAIAARLNLKVPSRKDGKIVAE
jgi:hypothetical protein